MNEIVLKQVVERLLGLVTKSIIEAAPEKLEELRSSFHRPTKQYVESYLRRHGRIQILRMSRAISITELYTRVRIIDPEAIESFESPEILQQNYLSSKHRSFNKKIPETENGIEVANAEQFLCVLGGPGIGKTTFLKKIGLEALLSEQGSYEHTKIPVFLELKHFAKPEVKLKDAIVNEFDISGFSNGPEFINRRLEEGNLLVLLDGLDEVPSNNFSKVITAINNLSDQYPKNRFMVSCRTKAYNTYFKGFRNVLITEYDEDQMYHCIRNWFFADLKLTEKQKKEYVEDCWKQLQDFKSIGTKELSQTPLLLTFICLVYRRNRTITKDRAQLYTQALDILLKEWAEEKYLEDSWEIYKDLHLRLEKDLLAEIAYEEFKEDRLFFDKNGLEVYISSFLTDNLNAPIYLDADAVIDAIAIQQGIFVERSNHVYTFSHLTLQEFLCAEHIFQWSLQEQLVEEYAIDDRWTEVFVLLTGLMGRAAIKLLLELEKRINKYCENPKINEWLNWVETQTVNSKSKFCNEIKRIFTLIFLLDLLALYICKHYSDFTHNRFSSKALEIARLFDNNLVNELERDRTNEKARAKDNKFGLYVDYALSSTKFVRDKFFVPHGKLRIIHKALSNLSEDNQDEIKSETNNFHFYDFNSKISSSLDIPTQFLDCSEKDIQDISNYLTTCLLMINCSKEANVVSAKKWDNIKQRMFLPKHTIEA